MPTLETSSSSTTNDEGPAPQQSHSGVVDGDTVPGVNLPGPVSISEKKWRRSFRKL